MIKRLKGRLRAALRRFALGGDVHQCWTCNCLFREYYMMPGMWLAKEPEAKYCGICIKERIQERIEKENKERLLKSLHIYVDEHADDAAKKLGFQK